MNTSRKIQIALGAFLLWSSTSASSFAATNTITPGKFQSETVKLPVESTPIRSLNLTQDRNLIAQSIRDSLSRIPNLSYTFSQFDEIWKNPVDRQKRLFDYCNSQKYLPVDECLSFMMLWFSDSMRNFTSKQDFDDLEKITDEYYKMTENR